jgi:polyferredoxin
LGEYFNTYNDQLKAEANWDQVIWDDYSFSLALAGLDSPVKDNPWMFFALSIGLAVLGGIFYNLPKYQGEPEGIKNNGIFHSSMKNRGILGMITGSFLILFYIVLYWFPAYLVTLVAMVSPISEMLSGNPASQWFLYGLIYTLAIIVMGVRMFRKYKGNKYQQLRTASVMFFQTAFAFLIPEILVLLNQPYFDFKNIWPLDYDFFYDYQISTFLSSGGVGMFMLIWGILLIIVGVPVFTYFFGKRWYCSWVCGCGGLAETVGDPFRQLSDKSLKAWKYERYIIHGVLVLAVVMTVVTIANYFSGFSFLGNATNQLHSFYGFAIGSAFAGVVGTGFYPFMGNRVWCRFGCPLAAYLGLVQRFKSRFRITTNGGQCISCGNCSTYCEMGIDVRAYAQKGQNIVRSSCVGCGVCSAVCPRGVLKLENGSEENRITDFPILIGNDSVKLNA